MTSQVFDLAAMKVRLASLLLLLAVLPWWLTACTNDEPGQRPRLLTGDIARIATMSGIEALEDGMPDHAGEMMEVRVMSCAAPSMTPALARSGGHPPKATAPRLVIGEPACVSITTTTGSRRID